MALAASDLNQTIVVCARRPHSVPRCPGPLAVLPMLGAIPGLDGMHTGRPKAEGRVHGTADRAAPDLARRVDVRFIIGHGGQLARAGRVQAIPH
jgi:hypothetical protein